jgi:spermidine synthase
LLLREAMAAMGGSELAWGLVMALWLAGMGFGSRVGVGSGTAVLARMVPVAVVVLAGFGVVLFRAAPVITGAVPGETITTWHSLWLWVVAILPAATAGGLAFPILASQLGTRGAGTAYSLEALGALLGGLVLSFVLAPLGATAAVSVTAGVVGAALVVRRSRPGAAACLLTGLVAAPLLGDMIAAAGWRWAGHPGQLGEWRETHHQRLELSDEWPRSLYADGRLLASYPDPFTTVPLSHLIMVLHPDPKRVFTIGCLANGAVQTMIRHPVEDIVAVEEDPQLLQMVPHWYDWTDPSGVQDPRVRTVAAEPLRALRSGDPWDLVVLLDGNPTTIRHNRTRTLQFFQRCRDHMREDGVLVLRLTVSDTYLGGGAGRLLEIMVSTLRAVFPNIVAVPGEEILLVAGRRMARLSLDSAELVARWTSHGVTDPAFTPEMLPLLVDAGRTNSLRQTVLAADAPVNTVSRPRAVLLAAGLLEARSRPSLLRLSRYLEARRPIVLAVVVAGAALLLVAFAAARRPPASATAAVIGMCSMGWWLLLIASWQATLGSVYAEVGALTAAFMGGLAGGSAVASRWSRPARHLPVVLAAGATLSIVIASQLPMELPGLLVPTLLVAAGALTGAAFPGIAELAGRGQQRRGAGIAFAADEAGAACAALLVGIVALPWAGLATTAGGLALLSLAAIPAVVVRLRRSE